MKKSKSIKSQPEAKPLNGFSFSWEGLEHKAGARYKVVLAQVGLEDDVELLPCSYHYGSSNNFTTLSFSSVDWCSFVVTLCNYKGEATMKWWQSDRCKREDGLMHFERPQKNPYRQAGYPHEIWNIPVVIKAGLIYEKGAIIPVHESAEARRIDIKTGKQLVLF